MEDQNPTSKLFELDPASRMHLTRFMKFQHSQWAERVPQDCWINIDLVSMLIDFYVEWLKAGEPE